MSSADMSLGGGAYFLIFYANDALFNIWLSSQGSAKLQILEMKNILAQLIGGPEHIPLVGSREELG
jgi:hypothetical protein